MSEIGSPYLPLDVIGSFGPLNISYYLHQGRFVGKTSAGPFDVPYWISTPVNPAQADGVCMFEPQHRFGKSIARDGVFGPNFLFAGGATHASVEHRRPGGIEDLDILREFAIALRQSPHVIKRVDKLYSIGFSETGNIVHKIYQPFGHQLFDLTFACNATYNRAYSPPVNIRGQKPIIVFGTENEFVPELIQHVAQNRNFPQYRWYTLPGAPHIPDTRITRRIHADPPVAGTTPINWVPFIGALVVAGNEWVKNGTLPPPSVTLRIMPGDPTQLDIDSMGNALGGIRHPALETREATFMASVPQGNWRLFGGYGNMRRIVEDFMGFNGYFSTFKAAVESLVSARFLLRPHGDMLLKHAQLNQANTFTRNYAAGLFV